MSHPRLFVSYCPNDNRPIGIDGDRFIDALCTWLAMTDIDTFKDVAETKRVIRNCDGSIIVFSKSYLKSKRFLENLYLIVRRQRRNDNHLIFQVFYDVDHADVKNQQGNFEIQGTVNPWRKAVTKVAKLRGMFASRYIRNSAGKVAMEISYKLGKGRIDRECSVISKPAIGKLLVSDTIIDLWCHNTIVSKGIYDSRPVAVKKTWKEFDNLSLKEKQHLIDADYHPNIVSMYGCVADDECSYFALELCDFNFRELITKKVETNEFKLHDSSGLYPSPELLKILWDVLCGLVHLHNFGIVHRTLKPSNVLLIVHNTFKWAKIADHGISKRLADGLMNLEETIDFDTQCWLPSEIHTEGVRETMAMDIFSFGCIVFYGVTGGKHPFGDYIERFRRIMEDVTDLSLVKNMPEAYHLISWSLRHDPDLRPTARELLHHPFFWDSKKRRLFLQTAGYRVEVAGYGSSLQIELDKTGCEVFSSGWIGSLDYDLQCYIYGLGHGTYRDDSLCDLLRVIRDLADHYFGLPSTVQSVLGGVSRNLWDVLINFESYFRTKFPMLVMSVYETLSIPCGEEEAFRDYYRQP